MTYVFTTFEKIRLDEFLRKELPKKLLDPQNASNSKIRRLIVAGSVKVNEMQCRRPAFELRGKSCVCVNFDEEKFFYEKQPDDIKFELTEKDVLFEDEFLICVNKPAFFPTEETIVGGEKRDNLHAAVVRYLWNKNPALRNPPYVGIMHRLDRETSGVILFTKQRSVNKNIQKMFESHHFTKIYKCLCKPLPSCSVEIEKNCSFSVEMYMNRISAKSQAAKWGRVSESHGGLYSKTDFYIEEKRNSASLYTKKTSAETLLLRAELFTGRTHQIRVHLASCGLPIVGDTLYGGEPAERIMLHAYRLEFIHPVSEKMISVTAVCPF
ncbi:MAG: RluA family pseudouridine synthase [Treponema sp.]|nr:RluA family pseudouridine synthase [Treponema sp.]